MCLAKKSGASSERSTGCFFGGSADVQKHGNSQVDALHLSHTIARESKRAWSLSWCTTCPYQLVQPIWTSKMMIIKQIIPLIPTKYPSIRFMACHRPRCHHNLTLSTAQSQHWYESTPTARTCAKASGAGQSLTSVCWTTTLIFSRPTTGISNHASCIYRKTTRRFAVARVTP